MPTMVGETIGKDPNRDLAWTGRYCLLGVCSAYVSFLHFLMLTECQGTTLDVSPRSRGLTSSWFLLASSVSVSSPPYLDIVQWNSACAPMSSKFAPGVTNPGSSDTLHQDPICDGHSQQSRNADLVWRKSLCSPCRASK